MAGLQHFLMGAYIIILDISTVTANLTFRDEDFVFFNFLVGCYIHDVDVLMLRKQEQHLKIKFGS